MRLYDELTALIDALQAAGLEDAVCGGLAVAIHGVPRATQDIDLLAPGDTHDRIAEVAKTLGYANDAGGIPFGAGTPYLHEVRRVSKAVGGDVLWLDLTPVEPRYARVWKGRTAFSWHGRTLTAVSRDGLAEMKRAAGRPQDLADLDRLGMNDEPGRP